MRQSCLLLGLLFSAMVAALARGDTLAEIEKRGTLIWGADAEGGGPYVYPDPANPRSMIGFEAELAAKLAAELRARAQFFQGPWHNLPALLGTGLIDIVLNGYELTPARAALMEHTRPYYIYQLVLLGRRGNGRLASWDDLGRGARDGRKFKVGVLQASAAQFYLEEEYPDTVQVLVYEGATDSMREVETGRLDAILTDLPAAVFYRDRFAALVQIGDPVARGYYVILLRKGDTALRDALNRAIEKLLADGELQKIYKRYGLWNALQQELSSVGSTDEELGIRAKKLGGWAVITSRGWLLVEAAGITVVLACVSMPLAMVLGLAVALGRMFGPAPLRWGAIGYIEILRGTPLLLQLYVIFFLLPEVGLAIPAFYAAVAGLAINYSAYEAEIYRAGLQAVPRGQMEAALALGMSQSLALRRVVIPQAVRIVVPPVTNDFINMFKDTSICSVITVMELTKQYTVQQNNTGATLELAGLTALLYLAMSIPLSRLASYLEKRLARRPKS
ncbi:MAG: ABC transporter substrate-binding protein/permease [Pirellulales bacterium]